MSKEYNFEITGEDYDREREIGENCNKKALTRKVVPRRGFRLPPVEVDGRLEHTG